MFCVKDRRPLKSSVLHFRTNKKRKQYEITTSQEQESTTEEEEHDNTTAIDITRETARLDKNIIEAALPLYVNRLSTHNHRQTKRRLPNKDSEPKWWIRWNAHMHGRRPLTSQQKPGRYLSPQPSSLPPHVGSCTLLGWWDRFLAVERGRSTSFINR